MKKLLFTMLFAACCAVVAAAAEKPLRVLVIGNSFSLSMMHELPNIMNAQNKHKLDITSMYIGGCSLERHIKEYETAVADPSHKPYKIRRFVSGKKELEESRSNLPEQLAKEPYDIVTIQQASASSWRADTWTPWGDKLITLVREKQPKAEIVIQETWSYRSDARSLARWKITNEEMYRKLREVYRERAKHYGFRMIPMGDAVQIYRKLAPVKYVPPTPAELAALKYPQTLEDRADTAGRDRWIKKNGKWTFKMDSNHLNRRGEYMQSCVWYGFLFNEDVEKIAYTPEYVKPAEDAKLLRKCAALALAGKTELIDGPAQDK